VPDLGLVTRDMLEQVVIENSKTHGEFTAQRLERNMPRGEAEVYTLNTLRSLPKVQGGRARSFMAKTSLGPEQVSVGISCCTKVKKLAWMITKYSRS